MNYLAKIAFFLIITVSVALAEHSGGCSACHTEVPELKEPYETLCTSCHKYSPEELKAHHTIEGKIECSDCHDPHTSGSGDPGLIMPVNDLCIHCHKR